MKNDKPVSLSVIRRLPRYHRFLGDLLARGILRISSKELADLMQLTASQIRQDFNCFGGFGQQGYGYNVELLHNEIGNILGLRNETASILIGAGDLGKTVAKQMELRPRGFRLIGIFDIAPDIIGTQLVGLSIQNPAQLGPFCRRHHPKVAVICIPKDAAAGLADRLVKLGIIGFWNFSSYDFTYHHSNVIAVNMHLGDSLMTLSYMLNHMNNET